ncbi:hypothetical protein DFZ72_21860 [Escherichia coli]|nr:hypothetical protein [Escherichia coli]
MRDDFCAFILTHGRPDKVLTYRTLRRAGYTGKIFIVVDDWICPYISRHLLSLTPLQARCRRYSRGER